MVVEELEDELAESPEEAVAEAEKCCVDASAEEGE